MGTIQYFKRADVNNPQVQHTPEPIHPGVFHHPTVVEAGDIENLDNLQPEPISEDRLKGIVPNIVRLRKFAPIHQNFYTMKDGEEIVAIAMVNLNGTIDFVIEAPQNPQNQQQPQAHTFVPATEEEILPYMRGDRNYWERLVQQYEPE